GWSGHAAPPPLRSITSGLYVTSRACHKQARFFLDGWLVQAKLERGFSVFYGAGLRDAPLGPRLDLLELLDLYLAVRKHGLDLQLRSHRLQVAAQGADVHIGALLHPRNRRLLDVQRSCQVLLRQVPG